MGVIGLLKATNLISFRDGSWHFNAEDSPEHGKYTFNVHLNLHAELVCTWRSFLDLTYNLR